MKDLLAKTLDQFQTVEAGHLVVGDENIEGDQVCVQHFPSDEAIGSVNCRMAGVLKHANHHIPDLRIILGAKHLKRSFHISVFVPLAGQEGKPFCAIIGTTRMGKNVSGPAIKRYRDKLGLSQEDLAARAQRTGWDIGRGVIAKIETGTRYVDDVELVKIAKLLRVSARDLLPKGC